MKIFFLCKRYYTNKDLIKDKFGRLYHLPVQLAKKGHDVTVTCIDYRNLKTLKSSSENVNFSTISAKPRKLLNLIPDIYWLIKKENPDVLIASGDSHIGYLALKISSKLRTPFAYDVYDYYPSFKSNVLPGMKSLFWSAIKGADLVLCASRTLSDLAEKHNKRTIVVENGVDTRVFRQIEKSDARKKLEIPTQIPVLGFFGSIAPHKGPMLIKACEILKSDFPDLMLLMAGSVDGVDIRKNYINHMGNLDQSEIPLLISACDTVVVPLDRHPQNDVSGACKIAEYLACKRPIVATRVSDHEQLFWDTPESLCDPNPTDMARALAEQLRSPVIAPFPDALEWKNIAKNLDHHLHEIKKTNPAH